MAIQEQPALIDVKYWTDYPDTPRVQDLRRRVREAMEEPPVYWECPARISERYMAEPLPVRKARALALKLSLMPADLWEGQLMAGSMTLESPHMHYEKPFPDYTTADESERAAELGLSIRSCFGHIVPDYPRLLERGLSGIMEHALAQKASAVTRDQVAFLDSVLVALQGVIDYADRVAEHCQAQAEVATDSTRAAELAQMAANLRQAPRGPAQSFWQALQSIWLLHMLFHATMNGNALGRVDQYVWPFLRDDLASGEITPERAGELLDCFCLKFNERAKTTEDQAPEARAAEALTFTQRTRHGTSSQVGTERDQVDATNHWLQNIVVGGLRPDGQDGTNPLTFLLLETYRRQEMTNPLLALRLHKDTPEELVRFGCEVLKDGGGMPALFNDEQLVPALEQMGIPIEDARDYTNDGCWEVIIPGRTDFRFQRLSLMLCLEWALNRGLTRRTGQKQGLDHGDARTLASFEQVWAAFEAQLDHMVANHAKHVADSVNDRHLIAPVPLVSALIDGPVEKMLDFTNGGAKHRTFGMLAESAAYAIDSLCAIKKVVFDDGLITMRELCDALDANFVGYEALRTRLAATPHYGNDDPYADAIGQRVIKAFTAAVARQAPLYRDLIQFPCGVATFSWYIGIGEGLGASPDGRLEGEPVSSNFSPALGRDRNGIPCAILSYGAMHHEDLPAGGPLDLRLNRHLVIGDEGTERMAGLVRSFVDTGGNMMTLTVVDTEELRAAQREPDKYRSLRVRMGGWCAYFTMLSHEQQEHHIKRQETQH